jgi:hypothetical protein
MTMSLGHNISVIEVQTLDGQLILRIDTQRSNRVEESVETTRPIRPGAPLRSNKRSTPWDFSQPQRYVFHV